MKKSKNIENMETAAASSDAAVIPKRVLLLKNFVCYGGNKSIKGASVTLSFKQGQLVTNPLQIKYLLENNAPIEVL